MRELFVEKVIRRIHKVKATKKVKETFTDENLEKLRGTCSYEEIFRNKNR